MSGKTGIEWTDRTWNPVVGCTKVSQGCKLCYAKTLHDMRHRAHLDGKAVAPQYAKPFEEIQLMSDRLRWPMSLQKPSRIFVNSVSDLFHEDVPDLFLDVVFGVMAFAERHQFQVLTKRADRMRAYLSDPTLYSRIRSQMEPGGEAREWIWPSLSSFEQQSLRDQWWTPLMRGNWPLKNVWLGVSVEDQAAADERIPLLLQTPAAVRFLSCEPLLGPVKLSQSHRDYLVGWEAEPRHVCGGDAERCYRSCPEIDQVQTAKVDWVITGGESGSPKQNPRPMHPDWARSLRDQCVGAGVPFLFKQHGEYREYDPADGTIGNEIVFTGTVHADVYAERAVNPVWIDDRGTAYSDPDNLPEETPCRLLERIGKKKAGRVLDGRTWDEYPEAR